jgi:spermidine synthase
LRWAAAGPGAGAGLLLTGFVTLLLQVLVVREIHVALQGVEFVDVLALGAWMAWSALGAALGAGRRVTEAALRRAFLLLLLLAPFATLLPRGSRALLGALPGASLPLGQQILVVVLGVALPGLAAGRLFRLCASLATGPGWSLGRAYALECLGALLGGALSTLLLALDVGNLVSALLLALLGAWAGFQLFRPWTASRTTAASLVGLLLGGLAVRDGPRLDLSTTRWILPHCVLTRDGPLGRISLEREAGRVALFENGALIGSSEDPGAELLTRLPALSHAAPERVLLLGGGERGVVQEALALRPRRLDHVEADDRALRLLLPLLGPEARLPFQDPALHSFRRDPRRFLRDAPTADEPYDLVLLGVSEPTSLQGARLFTREFFALCRGSMGPRSVLALGLQGAENLWTPAQILKAAAVVKALESVFPDVLLLPGEVAVALASETPLERDPVRLGGRLARQSPEARLLSPALVVYLYEDERRLALLERVRASPVPPNTDDRPIVAALHATHRLTQAAPTLTLWDPSSPGAAARILGGLAAILAPVALFLALLLRRGASGGRAAMAFSAGLLGMLVNGSALLAYPIREGLLYRDLGLLLCAFMAGTAAGSHLAGRAMHRVPAVARPGRALFLALGLLAATMALRLRLGHSWGLPGAALELVGAGALCGALVAFSGVFFGREDPGGLGMSRLYAMDLVGGALGAMLSGLLLVPLLGFSACLLVASGLAVGAAAATRS